MLVLGPGTQAGVAQRVGPVPPADGETQPGEPHDGDENVRSVEPQPDGERCGGDGHHRVALPVRTANLLVEHLTMVPTGSGVALTR